MSDSPTHVELIVFEKGETEKLYAYVEKQKLSNGMTIKIGGVAC